ncbi:MAG: hypothetical protein DWQ10_00195 [Calditrichaeota bacterium]|nr:MAG: hypothetical protein DWQ10_00195 [Calditrichota bacterium]
MLLVFRLQHFINIVFNYLMKDWEQMSTDKETFAAIGAAIRDNRLAQELTIKDVSEKLRINQEHLIKIEAGDMGFLPMPYVRAFIRSYAEFLKMDGQAVLERWQKVVASQLSEQDKSDDEIVLEKPVPEPERKIPTAKKAFQNEIIVGASFVAVVIFILFISTFDKEKPTQKEPEKKVTEKTVAQIPFEQVLKEVNNDSMQTEPDALPGETQSPVENLNLRIDATDSVWVRVTIDDVRRMKQFLLQETVELILQQSILTFKLAMRVVLNFI